jgi:putative addiction module component (TIGR02574 family)
MSRFPSSVHPVLAPESRNAQFESMAIPEIDFSKLSVEERLALISRIYDSIREEEMPDSSELADELRRRIVDADADPEGGVEPFAFLDTLRQRLG